MSGLIGSQVSSLIGIPLVPCSHLNFGVDSPSPRLPPERTFDNFDDIEALLVVDGVHEDVTVVLVAAVVGRDEAVLVEPGRVHNF